MFSSKKERERQLNGCRSFLSKSRSSKTDAPYQKDSKHGLFRLHPLFVVVGVLYCFTGELFLFLLSALVAIQHECAHAFASAKLGYKLNKIVLMPFGAVIDGDLRGISFKDEMFVALCGPLCNLITAGFFVAIWWLVPTVYAFTDTACYSSLAIGLVNFLPAYPLDGGRIVRCALARAFLKIQPKENEAVKKAEAICRVITLLFSVFFLLIFILQCIEKKPNFTLLAFGSFLFIGGLGNPDKNAVYDKIDFSAPPILKRGVEIRRVAVVQDCPIKDTLHFIVRGCYLVLEVYDENERLLFTLSQNKLSQLFVLAKTPYETLGTLYAEYAKTQKN